MGIVRHNLIVGAVLVGIGVVGAAAWGDDALGEATAGWLVQTAPASWQEQVDGQAAIELTRLEGVKAVSAGSSRGAARHPEHLIDDDETTEFIAEGHNPGAWVLIDLGRPCVIEGVQIANAVKNRPFFFLAEVYVGADAEHMRPLLGVPINLAMRPGAVARIPLPPSVGRFVKLSFHAGGPACAIAEARLFGCQNLPERHFMCWTGDVKRDLADKVDYLADELGVTDLWLDYIETAFIQGNENAGLEHLVDTGLLDKLNARGIRYWLSEHEAFTSMVNSPDDLRNDRQWLTMMRQMKHIYTRARALGFRGIVHDAEDYVLPPRSVWDMYIDKADHVDAWTFYDEFGYDGHYYQRGLQWGRTLKAVWDVPLLQVFEARMYAGMPGCRDGNYWWLKGIHDAGIEIWIATERTYGAGNNEIAPGWLHGWFVDMRDYIARAHNAYPFATRVLPGFHPWNCRTKAPNYLPKYLDEQLDRMRNVALGCWIYTEGIPQAGDPRLTLDKDGLAKYNIDAQTYVDILKKHPTARRPK